MALTLRRNIIWMFLGNGVFAASQWGIMIVLARLGGPQAVGRFALALAITAPVMILSNLALRQVQVTDAKGTYPFSDYLAVRVITSLLGLLIILGVTTLGGYRAEIAAVILAVGLAKAFEAISDIFYGLEQRYERLDLVARSLMIRGVLGLVALAIGYYFTKNLFLGVCAMATVWATVWLLYDLPVSRPCWQRGNRPVVAMVKKHICTQGSLRLVSTALPLGLATVLVSLNTNIPRYFVEQYMGEESLGVFAAMAYFVVAGGMIINAIGQAASPLLANYFAQQNLFPFRRLLSKMLLIGFTLGIAGVLAVELFGREILTLFYGPEFACNLDVFMWVMMAGIIHYLGSCLGFAITATRHFHRFLLPYSAVTCTAFVASTVFIPSYGLLGAAWVMGSVGIANCAAPLYLFYRLKREGKWIASVTS